MEIRRQRETILELGRKPEVNLNYFILFYFFIFCFLFHSIPSVWIPARCAGHDVKPVILLATSHWNYISIYYYTNTYVRESLRATY